MRQMVWAVAITLLAAPAAQAQTFELDGSEVAVYNLVGNIRIEAGSGRSAVAQVTRGGRDAGRLSIAADRINGRHTLRVIYPADEIVGEGLQRGSQTNLSVNQDGTFGSGRGGRRVSIRSGTGARDALHARADLVIRVPQGVKLDANLAVGRIDANGVNADLELESSAGEISVSGTRGALEAETASGGIAVRNVQGDLDLESASGGIEVVGARSQRIEIEVASGGITLDDVEAQQVGLETASGGIRVTRTRTPVLKAESASGSVRAELDGTVRVVEIETASGSAEAVLSAGFAGEVELETASGDIDIGFPLNVTSQRRNHVRGTVGSGGNARVYLSSASGDVKLLRR